VVHFSLERKILGITIYQPGMNPALPVTYFYGGTAQAGVPMGLAQASQSGNNTGSGGSNSPELGTGILASQQALADEQAQQ
jgi:hypothetical protein